MIAESEVRATARLWTAEGFRDDQWRHAEDIDAAPDGTQIILPLESWRALDAGIRRDNVGRIGVMVAPGEVLDPIVPHLPVIPLVALGFPAFSDGRSYSKAELLRSRYGYKGIIRASGDVLIDQIALMLRTGFDQFEVNNETALRRLEADRPGGLPFFYQPAARSAAPGAGYSWRRVPKS